MKTAIITGVCGQDGAYLAKLLQEKGYRVIGWARRNAPKDNLRYLGVDIEVVDIDICDTFHVDMEIVRALPDEIYNLAAQSHVGMSFKNPMQTCNVNYGGYLNILLSARKYVPKCKVYQAGTSEMYGYAGDRQANESTPFMPMSPYAISKVASYWAGVNARYEADQFVCNGILFNHESPIRGNDFVTRKITRFVANPEGILKLGNLDSVRDWGHAKDYVEAMYLMMQNSMPDDYVVATGNSISVRKFVTLAFEVVGKKVEWWGEGINETGFIDGKAVVEVSKEFYRPNDLNYLKGDPSKIYRVLNWKPSIGVEQLAHEMVNADIRRVS